MGSPAIGPRGQVDSSVKTVRFLLLFVVIAFSAFFLRAYLQSDALTTRVAPSAFQGNSQSGGGQSSSFQESKSWTSWTSGESTSSSEVPDLLQRRSPFVTPIAMGKDQDLFFSIKVFTCNRNNSLSRLLSSLARADYLDHRVDLEIIIDHCNKHGRSPRLACQQLATNFEWPFGYKQVRVREKQTGLRMMWFEAWFPMSENNIGVIFEDDMEVSRYWYLFSLRVVKKYYLEERDDKMIGLCLHPFGLPSLRQPFYKSRSICSWGSLLLPRTWTNFLTWVDERVGNTTYRPMLPPGTRLSFHRWGKVNYWMKANKDVWTSWFYRFIYESGNLFTISYCFNDCSVGVAVNHQEAGTNYPKTMETKWQLVVKPLDEYFTELPPLDSLDLRLDGLTTVGPCRNTSCPIAPQLDGDPSEEALLQELATLGARN